MSSNHITIYPTRTVQLQVELLGTTLPLLRVLTHTAVLQSSYTRSVNLLLAKTLDCLQFTYLREALEAAIDNF